MTRVLPTMKARWGHLIPVAFLALLAAAVGVARMGGEAIPTGRATTLLMLPFVAAGYAMPLLWNILPIGERGRFSGAAVKILTRYAKVGDLAVFLGRSLLLGGLECVSVVFILNRLAPVDKSIGAITSWALTLLFAGAHFGVAAVYTVRRSTR